MDYVSWMLILTGEVILVLEAECLKTFQVRVVVLHRLRLSPWAYAFSPLANHAASSLRLCFSFPSVFVDFLFLVATFNGHSRDFVVPHLLTHHRYISAHVQVLVLAIWIFVVFRSYQRLHQVLYTVLDNHLLYWWYQWRLWRWYRWRLWCLRVRMHTITRSGPLPLSPILCDGSSSSSLIGIGFSGGSGDRDRGRDRSRDTFSALALPFPPAGLNQKKTYFSKKKKPHPHSHTHTRPHTQPTRTRRKRVLKCFLCLCFFL